MLLQQMNNNQSGGGGSLMDANPNHNHHNNTISNNSSSSTTDNNNHMTGAPQFNQSDFSASEMMMMMMNQQGHAPNNHHSRNLLYPSSSSCSSSHDNDHHNHAPSSSSNNNGTAATTTNNNNTNATMPVGLTRLTSQVSDWLNFFWPHQNNNNNNPPNNNGGGSNNNNNNNTSEPPYQQQQHLNNSQNPAAAMATTLYERQRSAEAAALRAMALAHGTGDMLPPPPTATAIAPVYPPQHPPNSQQPLPNQQHQHQPSDIESLLQLHRQLSREIDSTPFTSLFPSNSLLSAQTSLPFFLPATSNEQPPPSDHVRNDDSTGSASQQQQSHVSSSSNKRQSQDRDEEGTASTTNQPPHHPPQQHYRSYRVPIPPEEHDDRPSKQPKLSHLWNAINSSSTSDYNGTVRNDNDDDDRKPAGRSSTAVGVTNAANRGNNTNAPAALSAEPSELEQSVSLTLLKLAESPSKLFSGLTSFFGANPSTMLVNNHEQNQRSRGSNTLPVGQPPQQQYPSYESTLIHPQRHQQQPEQVPAPAMTAADTAAASVDNTTGQQRKSQSSLLDDVEETPMEQRMRSLHQYA